MKPFPYQLRVAQHLVANKRVMLDADMGVGKTIMSLTALKLLQPERTLIICPAVAVANWNAEIKKWGCSHLSIRVLSYDKARTTSTLSTLVEWEPEILVLDEAHYLKNPEAKRTLAVYGKGGLAHVAKRVWLLSGTFAPNNAAEYYPHLHCLFSHLLPDKVRSYSAFLNYFCVVRHDRIQARGRTITIPRVLGNANVAEMREILAQTGVRIRASEVLPELPKLTWATLMLQGFNLKGLRELTREAERYLELVQQGIPIPPDSHLMQLRRLLSEAKATVVIEWLHEYTQHTRKKLVIFSQHINPLSKIQQAFKNSSCLLTGSTPSKKRGELVAKFQTDPDCQLFLGQLIACNTAITLTAASRILFLDLSFVPGENAQAAARCHRVGQHQPVLAQVVTLPHSLDEKVAEILVRKTQMLKELEYADHIVA